MKKAILSTALFLFFTASIVSAQDSTKHEDIFYTFIYNQVPASFQYPLVGLINVARGEQRGLQVGLTNLNEEKFEGAQVGFANAIGASGRGAQVGFVNASKGSFYGSQVGYVNLAGGYTKGAQVGFVNVAGKNTEGVQVGFVNATRDAVHGGQVGFVNATGNNLEGAQVGFVNLVAKTLTGSQVGFVNVADSISKGVPLGFLSYVRKGGFQAIEAGFSELYPVNLSFKMGVKPFYTFFMGSFNPDLKKQFALGAGVGSIIPLSRSFYFNPEALVQHSIERRSQQVTSLTAHFGYAFSDHWSLIAGPSVSWTHKYSDKGNELYAPAFALYDQKIDNENRLHVGVRAALRFAF